MKKLFAALLCIVIILVLLFVYVFTRPSKNAKLASEEVLINQATTKVSPTPTPKSTTLLLTGDIMLGRNVMNTSLKAGGFTYPFKNVSDVLRSSDIVFSNLENPVVYECPSFDSGFTFCSRPDSVDGLTFAGIDIVSLANNHTSNFGKKGLDETQEILKKKGVLFTGVGNLAVISKDDTTFGFLGLDFTFRKPIDEDFKLISDSDSKVDILVVAVHWGVEYEDTPRAFQQEWAKTMIEKGADVVAGNHPHWVQGAECFKNGENLGYTKAEELESFDCTEGKPVYYALGNFVFDQMWSEETKKGAVVEISFNNKKITSQKVLRSYIPISGQPKWVD